MRILIQTITIVVLLTMIFSFSLNAQHRYSTGVGLRGGYPSGVSGKHFISSQAAVEGVLSFGWGALGVTGLYQIHVPIPDAPGFNWYYGGGAHIAFVETNKGNPWTSGTDTRLVLGIDGVVGAEYVFADMPISISLDLVPLINFLPSFRPWYNSGLSVRYTFK